jgi:hypothetical protein
VASDGCENEKDPSAFFDKILACRMFMVSGTHAPQVLTDLQDSEEFLRNSSRPQGSDEPLGKRRTLMKSSRAHGLMTIRTTILFS